MKLNENIFYALSEGLNSNGITGRIPETLSVNERGEHTCHA
jgi:hypothetical protein